MSPRRSAVTQEPLPPLKDEIDAISRLRQEEQIRRLQHRRELGRERSRRYRARKAGKQ